MAFLNTAFPVELAALSSGDEWAGTIVELGGGHEQRNLAWSDSKREFDAKTAPNLTLATLHTIRKHFNAVRGQTFSFPLRDRSFFQATTEALGTGGGIGSTNQLTINDGNATNAYNREIYLPESGTIHIFANAVEKTEGVDWTLAYTGATGGLVTWLTSVSGQTLTWTGNFYLPVRYAISRFPSLELFIWNSGGTGLVQGASLPLKEVRYGSEF